MRYIFLITLTLLFSPKVFGQKTLDGLLKKYNTKSIPYISVEELRMLQSQEDIVILDTRELEEFETSHITSASHVGFTNFSVKETLKKITNKETLIIVYCSLGIRSEEIGEKLAKAGYTNVKNLYGGIFEWKNNSYPIYNLKEQETDSVHTFSKPWSKWLTKGIKVYKNNKNR